MITKDFACLMILWVSDHRELKNPHISDKLVMLLSVNEENKTYLPTFQWYADILRDRKIRLNTKEGH